MCVCVCVCVCVGVGGEGGRVCVCVGERAFVCVGEKCVCGREGVVGWIPVHVRMSSFPKILHAYYTFAIR